MRPVKRNDLTTRTNEETRWLLDSIDNQIRIKTKLKQLLKERDMTQRDLVKATGIGQNIISGFVTNREGLKIGYSHIYAIMIALRLTNISELLYVEMPFEIQEQFKKEAVDWLETKQPPAEIRKIIENSTRV